MDISKDIVCFFDGCCEPKNPGGNMGMGAIIYENGLELCTYSAFIPASYGNTNNIAEYIAFQWLLGTLLNAGLNYEPITIYGDSDLVIKQMKGEWKIKNGRYVEYAINSKMLLIHFTNIQLKWIPRDENNYADRLSKGHLKRKGVEFKIQPD
jgi:ribonuclease HI